MAAFYKRQIGYSLLITVGLCLIFVCVGWADRGPFFLYDQPVLLPAFSEEEIREGLTGKLVFAVSFEEGKVVSVRLKEERFVSAEVFRAKYPGLVELFIARMKAVLIQWKSISGGTFEETVTLELKIDSTLNVKERSYQIEYGDHSIPKRIVIIAPVLKK